MEPLAANGMPGHGPPDEERVTYVPETAVCQECRQPFALPSFAKCPKCHAADNLPPALVQFGELVKPLEGTGEP